MWIANYIKRGCEIFIYLITQKNNCVHIDTSGRVGWHIYGFSRSSLFNSLLIEAVFHSVTIACPSISQSEDLNTPLCFSIAGPLHEQPVACSSIWLTNYRAAWKVVNLQTPPWLVYWIEAQAKGCPCRGPVSTNIHCHIHKNVC